MKILCVCNGGQVRSVTLARLLRTRGYEVLVCGINKNFSDETLLLLFNWADRIFFQKDSFRKLTSRINSSKTESEFFGTGLQSKKDFRFDVGFDDWKIPQHPALLEKLIRMLDKIPVEGDHETTSNISSR